jgi:hypothetical protein
VGVHTEPVDSIDQVLKDVEECVDDPVLRLDALVDYMRCGSAWAYGQPLGVIDLAGGEEGLERVVARKDEASKVDEECTAEVEEDEEEVETAQAKDHVDFGHAGLLLEIVEHLIFGQLETDLVSIVPRSDTRVDMLAARMCSPLCPADLSGAELYLGRTTCCDGFSLRGFLIRGGRCGRRWFGLGERGLLYASM